MNIRWKANDFIKRIDSLVKVAWMTDMSESDREHIVSLGYGCSIFIPMIITSLLIKLIEITKFTKEWIVIISIIGTLATLMYMNKIIRAVFQKVKQKRIMLVIVTIIATIFDLIYLIVWIYTFSYSVIKYFGLFSDYLNITSKSTNLLEIYRSNSDILGFILFIFLEMTSLSLMLNMSLPEYMTKVNVSVKIRGKRIFRKSISLMLILVTIVTFYGINKNNFMIITAIMGLIAVLCVPEFILKVFCNEVVRENEQINKTVLVGFSTMRLIIYEVYFTWAISICLFSSDNEKRAITFAFLTSLFFIVTFLIKKYKKDSFISWIEPKRKIKKIPKESRPKFYPRKH